MIINGMVLAAPLFVRGVPHTFECVLFSDDGTKAYVSCNVIHALRRAFPGGTVDLGWSAANLPVIRLQCGPIYRTEAIFYIGGKFAGAVSMCFGGIPIDLHLFVPGDKPSEYHMVKSSVCHHA